jgi:hypothetical protein
MSAGDGDKRKVSTDALETLGTIIGPDEKRDAIHLAVEPVVARQALSPGDHVTADGFYAQPGSDNAVGIVDPFLRQDVAPGQRFWLVVYPRQIHSLRHVWTHPAFPDAPELTDLKEVQSHEEERRKASEAWLRNFCAHADCPGYEAVMRVLQACADVDETEGEYGFGCHEYSHEYLHFAGYDAHGEIPPSFWDHAEIVLGRKLHKRPTYFSCSC